MTDRIVFFDLETGGLDPRRHGMEEIMNARELLANLRAAGVEPMDDEEMDRAAGWALTQAAGTGDSDLEGRAVVAALEARAKLAEVREWAGEEAGSDSYLSRDMDPREVARYGERAAMAREVLGLLDKESKP